ncbi:MAG: hypothetical protein PUD63_06265 [Clostridia bacterium]|nr:hypothetical protein [Clostridia bacterium]
MYRKSYTGFVLWLGAFLAAMLLVSLIPGDDPAQPARALMIVILVAVAGLAWIIWRNERVYWYTGISFEQAQQAGSERRKAYALKHLRLFGGYALLALAAILGAQLARLPWWADSSVVIAGLIAAALRTTAYRL